MADSRITKRALAAALKELMEEVPFKKISVADICGKCNMNRKSFYYHFKDKHDLVNWIFDTEVLSLPNTRQDDQWHDIEKLCRYLYDHRSFYCKVFPIQGQNSLAEHFREFIHPPLQRRIEEITGPNDVHQIGVNFFADGIMCAIMRWLLNKDCIPPEQFVSVIRNVVESAAISVCKSMDQK